MATYYATNSTDTLRGQGGIDTFVFTATSQIQSGDVFNGGNGTGIDTVFVDGDVDFSGLASDGTAGLVSFGALAINGAHTATFNASQFGTGKLSTSLAVSGNTANDQTLVINNASNFSAAGFTYTNWTQGSDRIILNGTSGNDSLVGSSYADSLVGGAGNDTLNGGAGNDTISGGADNDTLNGGADSDALTYSNAAGGVTVSLSISTAQSTGGAGTDTVTGFENLIGSAFADSLTGDSGNNALSGLAGNDTLVGGLGDDTLDGGADTDTASYAAAGAGVTASLATGTATGGAGSDTLVGIENLVGTGFADSLTGDGGNNVLTGGAGNDTIEGGTGGDTLDGGADVDTVTYAAAGAGVTANLATGTGSDTLIGIENLVGTAFADSLTGDGGNNALTGSAGNDTIEGGAGDDALDGGADSDTASYASATAGVTVSLGVTGAQKTGGAGTDTLIGFENLLGSGFADQLGGDGGNNLVQAGAGNDTVAGTAGNDTLDGGTDFDTLDYSGLNVSIAYDVAAGTVVKGGDLGTDTVIGFEGILLGSGNDTVTGDSGHNAANGGGGNDLLYGLGGNDTLNGGSGSDQVDGGVGDDLMFGGDGNDYMADGAGADTLDGGDGDDVLYGTIDGSNDVMIGGAGNDTIDFRTATGGVSVVATTAGTGAITFGTETDSFTGFERIMLGTGSDTFIGSSGDDVVIGYLGADSLSGGGGNDTFLIGYNEGIGDTIEGGAGTADRAQARSASVVVNWTTTTGVEIFDGAGFTNFRINLTPQDDTVDFTGISFVGVERVDGLAGNDLLDFRSATFSGQTRLEGGAGDDTIIGNGQDNVLSGGTGNDSLVGGAGNDTFLVQYDSGFDVIVGGEGAADAVVAQSASANVRWVGISGIEIFNGGSYTNFRILGSTGDDAIDLSGATLINVERIDGGAGNDTIIGNAADNRIAGGAGTDSLVGGDGNDTFLVQSDSGMDTIEGGAGTADRILAMSAGATVYWAGVHGIEIFDGGSYANFRIAGSVGGDVIDLSGATLTNVALIDGGAGNDAIIGNNTDDRIAGGLGNDSLVGGGGNDTFLIQADGGIDTIAGGDGVDAIIVQSINTTVYWANISGIETFNGNGFANFRINGSAGADIIDFSAATLIDVALIDGGAGNDTIIGDGADNRIVGGLGNDSLVGGGGNDTFYIQLNSGVDAIDGGAGTADSIVAQSTGVKLDWTLVSNVEAIDAAGYANFQITGSDAGELLNFGGVTLIGIDRIDAGLGNDTVLGSTSNDTIIGGKGDDSLAGGDGNDTFFLQTDSGSDTIDGGAGTADRIIAQSAGTYVAWANTSGIEIFDGNGLANFRINGTSDANVIDLGATTLYNVERIDGGAGNDTILGSAGDDRIYGGTGVDSLSGGAGNDTILLQYDSGADAIDGGAGTGDTILALSASTNVYWKGVTGVEVFNGAGYANFRILGSLVGETIDLSKVTLTGVERIDTGAGDDTVIGSSGDDRIYGGIGSDSQLGGAGNDTFILQYDSGVDVIDGGAGTGDTILAQSASTNVYWSGVTGVEVFNGAGYANFRILGSGVGETLDLSATTLIGVERIDAGAGDDTVVGSNGDDHIYGGIGADSMVGGSGNDTFLVQYDSGSDIIDGGAGTGDTIFALSASTMIDWTKVSGVEVVNANGYANFRLVGTAADDTLDFTGVALTDVSVIDGGSGNDLIIGSAGNDTILGGLGSDTLAGGAGADTFRFSSIAHTSAELADHILDFEVSDRIDFSGIDADTHLAGINAFTWIGGDDFTGAGQLRAYVDEAGHTVVEANNNADLAADFRLVLDSNFALSADHFVGLAM